MAIDDFRRGSERRLRGGGASKWTMILIREGKFEGYKLGFPTALNEVYDGVFKPKRNGGRFFFFQILMGSYKGGR